MEIFILVVTVFYVALKCLIDMSQIVFINNYKMTNDEINKLELNANDYNKHGTTINQNCSYHYVS